VRGDPCFAESVDVGRRRWGDCVIMRMMCKVEMERAQWEKKGDGNKMP
jgi:hypothetical protein